MKSLFALLLICLLLVSLTTAHKHHKHHDEHEDGHHHEKNHHHSIDINQMQPNCKVCYNFVNLYKSIQEDEAFEDLLESAIKGLPESMQEIVSSKVDSLGSLVNQNMPNEYICTYELQVEDCSECGEQPEELACVYHCQDVEAGPDAWVAPTCVANSWQCSLDTKPLGDCVDYIEKENRRWHHHFIVMPIGLATGLFFLILCACCCVRARRRRYMARHNIVLTPSEIEMISHNQACADQGATHLKSVTNFDVPPKCADDMPPPQPQPMQTARAIYVPAQMTQPSGAPYTYAYAPMTLPENGLAATPVQQQE